jgi:ribosomal protein L40E
VVDRSRIGHICNHCGAEDPVRLGKCEVCGLKVCTKCGNTQRSKGEAAIVHDSCLGEMETDGFSMIKFIK